jgi:hypothetical protein
MPEGRRDKMADPVVSVFDLHQRRDHRACFAALRDKNFRIEGLMGNWVITDPNTVLTALKNTQLRHATSDELISKAELICKREMHAIREANSLLAVLHEGPDHARMRKSLANYLAARLKDMETLIPRWVAASLQGFHAEPCDLCHSVARPLAISMAEGLIGGPIPSHILDMELYDVFPSAKTAHQVDQTDRRFHAVLEFVKGISSGPEDICNKLNCLVFGVDSVMALLVESMLAAFDNAKEGEAAFLPEYPPETGVPVTTLVAESDLNIDGLFIAKGEVLRLQLQPMAYATTPQLTAGIFGAGAHACIGRNVSLAVWRHFRRQFNDAGIEARVTLYDPKRSNFVSVYHAVTAEVSTCNLTK